MNINSQGTADVLAGRYRPTELIASGASGAVYRAVDTKLGDEIVAIKFIHTFLRNDKELMRRLRNEVLISRRLSSPHIVQVYDFGFGSEGIPFVVMEFVDGVTLRRKLSQSGGAGLSVRETIGIVQQLLTALSVAHAEQIVHHDVKPENILFDRNGTLKLADFGISRLVEIEYSRSQTQETLGTPTYISPEQLRGSKGDLRSDLYAAGVLTYELLSGQPPFRGDTFFEIAAKHLHEEPSIDGIPEDKRLPWVSEFVLCCLEKNPEARFPGAAQALTYLDTHSTDTLRPSVMTISGKWHEQRKERKKKERLRLRNVVRVATATLLFLLFLISVICSHTNARAKWSMAEALLTLERLTGWELNPLKAIYGVTISVKHPEQLFSLIQRETDYEKMYFSFVLIKNCDVFSLRNAAGDTILTHAVKMEHEVLIDEIIGKWKTLPPIQQKRFILARDGDGHTALELALRLNHHLGLSYLTGLYPEGPYNDNGDTMLHLAVHYGTDLPFIDQYPGYDKLVRHTNKQGNTALHLVMDPQYSWKHQNALAFIYRGGDVNAKNAQGDTALLVGVKANAAMRVAALVTANMFVDVGIPDAAGKTALMLAVEQGNAVVADALSSVDRRYRFDAGYRNKVLGMVPRRNHLPILNVIDKKPFEGA